MLPSSVIDMTIIASLSCFSAILSRPAAPGVQACFRALVTTSVMSRASGTARSGSLHRVDIELHAHVLAWRALRLAQILAELRHELLQLDAVQLRRLVEVAVHHRQCMDAILRGPQRAPLMLVGGARDLQEIGRAHV